MNKVKEFLKNLIYPDREFYKLIFSLAIPITLQNLITIGVNLTDTLMLGMLGEAQLSASSLAGQFVNMHQIFTMGTSMGASVLVSRYWGMGEMNSLRKSITIMVRILMGLAVIFAAITLFAPRWVMTMYTKDEVLISEGMRYLRFMVPTFFFYGLSQGSTIIMRSIQKVKLPLCVSIGAFLTNIIGNYVLMFGKFGLPALGIAGAAISTLIVRTLECIFNFGYLAIVEKDVKFRLEHIFTLKVRELVPEYIRISIPVLISDGLLAFGNNAVMMIVGRIGSHFVSANAVAAVVERFTTSGIGAVGQVGAMITGKNLGEGDKEKVQKQGVAFFGVGTVIGFFACIIILIITEPVIALYGFEPATAEVTRHILHASAIIVLFQTSNGILTKGVLRGGGDTKVLMIADSFFLWVVSIPLGFLAGLVLGLPPFFIYFALRMENVCKTFWGVHRLNSGKWIKKIKSFG